MPLPQNVVDRLAREPLGTPGWSKRLLLFSLTVLVLSLFVYGGLEYGYLPALKKSVVSLDQKIQQFSEQVPLQKQQKLVAFYSQLSNIRSLLDAHVAVSPFFLWFEKNTLPTVQFTRFALTTGSRQLSLSGVARQVEDVANQLAIFKNDQGVERGTIASIVAVEGGVWRFDMTLFFEPGFFTVHPSGAAGATSTTQ